MDEILKDIYYNCLKTDLCKETSEYYQLADKIDEYEVYMETQLTGEIKQKFSEYVKMYEEMEFQTGMRNFISGMKLGARLTSAMLGG